MKKMLWHLKELLATGADRQENPFGEEIISRFEKWVKQKGFCRPDETMEDTSARLGISKFELSWVSRRIYGDNFLTLRKRLRVYEAEKLLLADPEAPVGLVGERVGITDKTNFRRQFSEITGMSPQEWRDTHLMLK